MRDNPELACCPECGNRAIMLDYDGTREATFCQCMGCGHKGPAVYVSHRDLARDGAIAEWNRQ